MEHSGKGANDPAIDEVVSVIGTLVDRYSCPTGWPVPAKRNNVMEISVLVI
jgi:hypothetical protein